MDLYQIRLFGTDTTLAISNGYCDLASLTALSDYQADLASLLQPFTIDAYYLDWIPDIGKAKKNVGGYQANNTAERSKWTVQAEELDINTEYEDFMAKFANIRSYKKKYMQVTRYAFDLDDHYSGNKVIPIEFIQRSIEDDAGKKLVTFEVQRAVFDGVST